MYHFAHPIEQIRFAMRRARHTYLVEKATHAAVAAIEVYNKPGFKYREETFAILMLNAWELLLKARILKENRSKLRSIEVWESKPTNKGKSSKLAPKKNRAGNTMTIGVLPAANMVKGYTKYSIDDYAIENMSLLMEIRDNAIHFLNVGRDLHKRLQQVGAAALRNFAFAAKSWFDCDLSQYQFALMPVAFETPDGVIQTVFSGDTKGAAGKVAKLLADQERKFPFEPSMVLDTISQTMLFRETRRNRLLARIQLPPKTGPRHHFLHVQSQWKRSMPLLAVRRLQWRAQRCTVCICDARKAAASAMSAATSGKAPP